MRRINILFSICLFTIILSLFSCSKDKLKISDINDSFNWDSYRGKKIKLICNKHPWIDLITPMLPDFERLTGITVDINIYPEDQFRAKLEVELVSEISDVDILMIMPGQDLAKYTSADWLFPLNKFINSRETLWPDYEIEDFYASAFNTGIKNSDIYAIPILLETSLLAYNKEIFKRYGVLVPKTMEELENAAKKIFYESNGEIYGITMRGKSPSVTSQWVDFLHSFGGEWLNEDHDASVNTTQAIKATDFYGRLLRLYGPKSATSNTWYENISIFIQGKAAMIYDASVFKSIYEDNKISKIAGKVGYAMIPKGDKGAIPHVSNWGLGIYSGSKNKEAAWLFIQWATSKEIALKGLLVGIPAARISAWESPEFKKTDNLSSWTYSSIESYKVASIYWNPPVVSVAECREVMGDAIVRSILGGNVKDACNYAAKRINEIIIEKK